jgi:hypothetical protein
MRSKVKRNDSRARRGRSPLVGVLAIIIAISFASSATGGAAQKKDQQGVSKVTCNADNIYIYKYPSTNSERRKRLGRGAHFQVYHYVNGVWAFGVHNASGVSGNVLREKLCN